MREWRTTHVCSNTAASQALTMELSLVSAPRWCQPQRAMKGLAGRLGRCLQVQATCCQVASSQAHPSQIHGLGTPSRFQAGLTYDPRAIHLAAGEENAVKVDVKQLLPLEPSARPPKVSTLMTIPVKVSFPKAGPPTLSECMGKLSKVTGTFQVELRTSMVPKEPRTGRIKAKAREHFSEDARRLAPRAQPPDLPEHPTTARSRCLQ